MSVLSSRLKKLFINTNKIPLTTNTTMSTSRSESLNNIFRKKGFDPYSSPIHKTILPSSSDNYSFLSNANTFLIQNPNSLQREKSIEYSEILRNGSMKDLHRDQNRKELSENRRTTSRNSSSSQSKTICVKINNYTKELKKSVLASRGKALKLPMQQHQSASTRNFITQSYHSSLPPYSSCIKSITVTRNERRPTPLEWSTNASINLKPVKKTMHTVTSIGQNLKTSTSNHSISKKNANY